MSDKELVVGRVEQLTNKRSGMPSGDIVIARASVVDVPALQQEIATLRQQLADEKAEALSKYRLLSEANGEIASLNTRLAEAREQCEQADRSAKGWMETARLADTNAEDCRAKLAATEQQFAEARRAEADMAQKFYDSQEERRAASIREAKKTEALKVASSVLGWVATMSDEGDIECAVRQAREAESEVDAALAAPDTPARRKLTMAQADEIEDELRRMENDPSVTKTALRLCLQHPMPCGHAAGNLLICDQPPCGCVICGEPDEPGKIAAAPDDGVAKRMRRYMTHKDSCPRHAYYLPEDEPKIPACTCGLDALLRELGVNNVAR